jgi:hypothetical protein
VVFHRVRHGAHETHAVHDAGHARQAVAHRQAGNGRGDRAELAADLVRGAGLHVEGVGLARPAELVEEDHGAGPGLAAGAALGSGEESRQRQAEEGAADLEQLPACRTVMADGRGHV